MRMNTVESGTKKGTRTWDRAMSRQPGVHTMLLLSILTIGMWIWPIYPVLALEDADLQALVAAGNTAYERMDYDTALEIYDQALKAVGDAPVLLYNKANVLYRQGKYTEALVAYEAAIKAKPPQVLLKNLYYNAGNAHVQIARQKEAKAETQDGLKQVMAEYEKSFEMYRQALDLDRKVGISLGYDLHRSAIPIRQNWALARQGWTRAWERLRQLQKKDLKLEDGIRQILEAQQALHPKLETIYLTSFSEDALKFNLKALAQFQLDFRDDVYYLRELAQKDVERIQAEIDNHRSAKSQASGQASGSGGASVATPGSEDPELETLKQQKNVAEKILEAVTQAIGLEEWIVDGFNRSEVLKSWQYSRQMVGLLQGLVDFLKKADPVPNTYRRIIQDLMVTENLLKQAGQLEYPETKGSWEDIKSRIHTLCVKKLEAVGTELDQINQILDQLKQEIEKGQTKEPEPTQDPAKGKIASDPVSRFMTSAHFRIMDRSVDDVLQRNQELTSQLDADMEVLNSGTDMDPDDFQSRIVSAMDAMTRYGHIRTPVVRLLSMLVEDSETVEDQLAGLMANPPDPLKNSFGNIFSLSDILLFKYRELVAALETESETGLEDLKKHLPDMLPDLEHAWDQMDTLKKTPWHDPDDIRILAEQVAAYRDELLRHLLVLAPDLAMAHYFQRAEKLIGRMVDLLPSTPENAQSIESARDSSHTHLSAFNQLLSQYFQHARARVDAMTDKDAQTRARTALQKRERSQLLLSRAVSEVQDAGRFLESGQWMKADLLIRDIAFVLEKAKLRFLSQPNQAIASLETAIQWQKALQEQSRAGTAIESEEGGSRTVAGYVAANQSDIMDLAMDAIGQIRDQMKAGTTSPAPSNQAPMVGPPAGQPAQQCPMGPDPEKMEQAIAYIQDALIEAGKIRSFLDAAEFHNTEDKHGRVMELFQKALDALKHPSQQNPDDKKQPSDQNNPDKSQQQGQQGQTGQQRTPARPMELTPDQARDLLNRLNQADKQAIQKKKSGKALVQTPRPW